MSERDNTQTGSRPPVRSSRVARVEIRHFRGIPGIFTLDLSRSPSSEPCSLLVTGDNGSGKSSIVDAIEFALQGTIGQSRLEGLSRRPSLASLAVEELPTVSAFLADGSLVRRGFIRDEDGLLLTNKEPHPGFSVSPIVLRRSDILRFLDSSEADRKLVFWHYLRTPQPSEWKEPPADELDRLKAERLQAQIHRDRARDELANELGIKVDQLPPSPREFREFVKRRVYGGLTREEVAKRGSRVRVKPRIEDLVKAVREAGQRQRHLKVQIREFAVSKGNPKFPKHLLPTINSFLDGVAPRLTDAFKAVSPLPFVDRFRLEYGSIGELALSVSVVLTNGRQCSP